ncbi:MAG: pyridoxal-phosphate dependent enzyme, partial [Bdellovibrionales bacterium]
LVGSEMCIRDRSHIVMPLGAPLAKVQATRDYGATVYQSGDVVDDAYDYCMNLNKEHGYEFVHPYLDPDVIAGQGTIGLEILEQVKNLDSVVISVGGGGLISGAALALKELNPKIKVYGAVAESAPGMYHLFKSKGKDVGSEAIPTIADGIAIKKPSLYIYENYISKYVDDMVLVSEEEMAEAMVFLLERAKAVVEGAGAAGLAGAKKASKEWDLGDRTAVVLCGGNVDLNLLSTVIEKGLSKVGRMTRVKVATKDLPGNLHRLTAVLAELDANIIDVTHDRVSAGLGIRETLIEFLLDTKNDEHIKKIKAKFEALGVRVLEG